MVSDKYFNIQAINDIDFHINVDERLFTVLCTKEID